MTGAEFRRIRKSLDPRLFEEHLPEAKPGPGRKPTGEVTQEVLAAHLQLSTRNISRYETGRLPVPHLVADAMRRLALGARARSTRAKK